MAPRLAGLLLGACTLAGCGHDGPDTGTLVVTVTLSRSGCPLSDPECGGGPSFDHAPQAGERVTVTSAGSYLERVRTGSDGVARLVVPVGTYDVEAPGTDMGPELATVRIGRTTRVRFDAVAP